MMENLMKQLREIKNEKRTLEEKANEFREGIECLNIAQGKEK